MGADWPIPSIGAQMSTFERERNIKSEFTNLRLTSVYHDTPVLGVHLKVLQLFLHLKDKILDADPSIQFVSVHGQC